MAHKNKYWQVTKELAAKYTSPLDRKLFCDDPLLNLLGDLSGKAVLDIGCGNGGLTIQLAQQAGKVIGIDTSAAMLEQATKAFAMVPNLSFQKADGTALSFADESFDNVIGSMLINTINTATSVGEIFQEAKRVLKKDGKLVISMSHPLTLDQKTSYRSTLWKEGQSQQTLKPGDEIIRQFVGKDSELLTVTNYYWPPDELQKIATKVGFTNSRIVEPKASQQDLQNYPELDPNLVTTPFFLLMRFEK